MSLGARIAQLRLKRGESLQQVADAVGVSKAHIWELEKGRTDNPAMALVVRLADHFGVSVSFLVDEVKPDVICVHAGATTREKEPVKASLERARTHCRSFIVLYHNYAASMANSPEFLAKMKAINPDQIVVLERGVTPLVDAVRARYGLKTTVVSRRPLA